MTQAFGLYDTVSGLMVHADLYPAQAREREMLADSLRHVRPDDLLLLDRGFPAYWLFAWLIEQGRHFCMRVDALGFEAIEQFAYASEADETVVEINMPAPAMRKAAAKGYVLSSRVFQLRLIRVRLPSGQTEILATSLLDRTRYPMAEFAALYHRRWRIEECFKLIKARLQVENWSGVLPHTVEQDFYASFVRANCAAALALEADPAHACLYPPTPGTNGWRRALNCTLVIKSLRHALPQLLLNIDVEDLIARLLARLRKPGAKELTRADRQAPRPRHDRVRIAGFHFAYKSA